MGIEIRKVCTLSDLKKFIKFPLKLYKGNDYIVPPLIIDELNTLQSDKNPAFSYCEACYWLAYKNGVPVGRIAGIINHRYIEEWGRKNARFGWIDFIDDLDVSAALLGQVEEWAQEKGMEAVHGPLGFCDLDKQGMLVEGFEEQGMYISIYNHPYYPVHLERHGYKKEVDWIEYELRIPPIIPQRVKKIADLVTERYNLKVVRAVRTKEILPYARELFDLLNQAYCGLFGVVTLNDEQIDHYIKQYLSFVNPDFVRLVLDKKGELVGFAVALPSLARAAKKAGGKLLPFGFIHFYRDIKTNTLLDLYLIGVKPELRNKGINAVLMAEMHQSCLKNGMKKAETGPQLEENKRIQAMWKYYEKRQHKRRRCYCKKI